MQKLFMISMKVKTGTTNSNNGISKIHQHLQKNMNVKEKLKQQFKQ